MNYNVILKAIKLSHLIILLCRWREPEWLLDVEAASDLFPSSIYKPRKDGEWLRTFNKDCL